MSSGIKKIDENVITPYRSLTITNPTLPDNTNWQIGTLKCNPTLRGLSYKIDATGNFDFFDASYILLTNTITSELIKDGTIQTIDLKDGCVTNDKIANRTIDHTKLKLNTLTDSEMGNESITARALARQCVVDNEDSTISKIAYHTILNRSLADASIQYRNMCSNSVGTLQLINSAVTDSKLATGSVTSDKIKDASVNWSKIEAYSIIGGETTEAVKNGQSTMVQGRIAKGTITNWNIKANTINEGNLMTGAVSNRTIGSQEIYGDKIKAKSISTNHLSDRCIGSDQVMVQGLYTDNYKDQSITKAKLAPNVLDVINNAISYDSTGNVAMLQTGKTSCDVAIGSKDISGASKGNGSLRVYGNVQADRVYNMAYSDLAEGYVPGEKLEAGQIVELHEDGKVYKAKYTFGSMVVGVVSDEYAACYGATEEELNNGSKVAVGLIGKVHVMINGPIRLGQKVSADINHEGMGRFADISTGMIGHALETVDGVGPHKVLCLIRPY